MSLTPRSVALLIIQLHFLSAMSAMPALIVGPFQFGGEPAAERTSGWVTHGS